MNLFTLGYGGRTKEQLLALLRENGIRTVVDVRLRPDRSSMGLWVKAKTSDKGIEKILAEAGIGYRSLVELGNLFMDLADWTAPYEALLQQSGDLLTARLLDNIQEPMCLLCAEKRVADCHRRLIADYLVRLHGAKVKHIE